MASPQFLHLVLPCTYQYQDVLKWKYENVWRGQNLSEIKVEDSNLVLFFADGTKTEKNDYRS